MTTSFLTFAIVSLLTGPPATEKLRQWLQTTDADSSK